MQHTKSHIKNFCAYKLFTLFPQSKYFMHVPQYFFECIFKQEVLTNILGLVKKYRWLNANLKYI